MKVIFVGMHNKADKMPLCSSTKSGKLVNRIIEALKPVKCLKTNLYDIDYFPQEYEKFDLAMNWHERIDPIQGDVIVLLGAEVHENFIKPPAAVFNKIVKIAHPASKRSHAEMDDYVEKSLEKILNLIKT